jgi:hypothetical protein
MLRQPVFRGRPSPEDAPKIVMRERQTASSGRGKSAQDETSSGLCSPRAARKQWLTRFKERMLLLGQRRRRRYCERQARMTICSRREVVTFKCPFRIWGIDRQLPGGDYEVITDEETIEALSFEAFRRVATILEDFARLTKAEHDRRATSKE